VLGVNYIERSILGNKFRSRFEVVTYSIRFAPLWRRGKIKLLEQGVSELRIGNFTDNCDTVSALQQTFHDTVRIQL
jgi:hypothetical protein